MSNPIFFLCDVTPAAPKVCSMHSGIVDKRGFRMQCGARGGLLARADGPVQVQEGMQELEEQGWVVNRCPDCPPEASE